MLCIEIETAVLADGFIVVEEAPLLREHTRFKVHSSTMVLGIDARALFSIEPNYLLAEDYAIFGITLQPQYHNLRTLENLPSVASMIESVTADILPFTLLYASSTSRVSSSEP